MKRKAGFACVATMVVISMIACSSVYRFHYQKGRIKGWVVVINNVTYTAFTADENGILPENRNIAQARFERRKDFIEKHYKIEKLGTTLTQLALLPVGAALFPVFIADEYREHVFTKENKISEEEREKYRKQWAARDKILKDFIDEDMQKEREIQ